MECLPLQSRNRTFCRTIDRIPQKRMTKTGHMDTNLMRPACFQTALDKRIAIQSTQNLIMSDGWLAIFIIDRHFLSICRMTADRGIHRPLIVFQIAVDDCIILSGYRMSLELGGYRLVGLIVFADDQYPRSIFVNSVNNSRAQHTVDPRKISPAVIHQPIDQRAGIVACRRMNHHIFRLIDQQNVLVFI